MTVRYDESVAKLVESATSLFGNDTVAKSAIIRDAGGRLSLVLPTRVDTKALEAAETSLHGALGAYARPERVVADITAPGAQRLLAEAQSVPPITIQGLKVKILDRRIVGADWLKPPAPSAPASRIVFSSLKGGVGRSTALCVMAAHLSRRGRRILAVDLDLEAPGIGTMLLRDQELPEFGSLDYLVENGISGIDSSFFANFGADSILGSEGGRVTVIPAIGRRTINNPGEILGKIARAYLEDLLPDGTTSTFTEQVREMIERCEKTGAYDVVLVDVRAGLHESTAAALLGLGAEVLLFGANQPQTFLGYRLLMNHLARFHSSPEDDWRDRLHFVYARAPEASSKRVGIDERFSELYEIVAPSKMDTPIPAEELSAEDFDMSWDDSAPDPQMFEVPAVLHVLEDTRYRDFDPILDPALLASATYSSSFEELIEFADLIAGPNGPTQT